MVEEKREILLNVTAAQVSVLVRLLDAQIRHRKEFLELVSDKDEWQATSAQINTFEQLRYDLKLAWVEGMTDENAALANYAHQAALHAKQGSE